MIVLWENKIRVSIHIHSSRRPTVHSQKHVCGHLQPSRPHWENDHFEVLCRTSKFLGRAD